MKYPIKELNVVEIFSASFRFCKDNLRFLAILACISFLPELVLSLSSDLYSVTPERPDAGFWSGFMNTPHPRLAVIVLNLVVSLLTYSFCTAAIAWGVTQRYLGFDVSVGDCIRAVWSRFGQVLGATILSGLGIAFGYIFCFVPGIYLVLAWFVLYPALMFEDVPALDAMARSQDLMRGQKLRALVIIIVIMVVTMPVCLLSWPSLSIPGHYVGMAILAVSRAVGEVASVFCSVAASVMYISARCCIEPISMETLIQTIEATRENDDFCSEHAPN